jgi:phenylacetaldehyde dehydrogenase
MKNVSLELGGKSPNVVLPDADLDQVLASATDAIFFNQGQVCTAGSRLYVHADVYDDVMSGLVDRTRTIVVGPGTDPATQMGPVVSARQFASVNEYLDVGRAQGATVLTGGGRVTGLGAEHAGGYFIEPTIFADTDHTMRVVREEIFGPVLVAMRWKDIDELVDLANDTPYGLSAGIWTQNLARAHQLAARIKAGTVWVNCYNYTDPASPFGGYKQSGWGREMGRAVLEAYTETKSVWVNVS